ncbi:MAG: extracellular solute-binding protein [Caldilineaceae bacterium]
MNSLQQGLSRRRFMQFSGLAASVTLLAACSVPTAPGAAPAGGESGAAPSAETKTLEAWSRMTDIDQESVKGILDNYNASNNKGAQVEFVYIAQTQGSQADEKLLTAVAGGSPPAVYYADRFTVPQFAYQGFFTNITDLAEGAGVTKDQYYDFAWEETIYKGDIYALSFDTDTRALWYNKTLMQEAGVDPEAPPTTLDELFDMMDKLTVRGAGGAVTRFGFNPIRDQAELYTWGWAFKGEFQDPETKRITFNTPENIAAAKRQKEFVDAIGVQDVDAQQAACAGGACNGPNNPFLSGQQVMSWNGDWMVAQTKQFTPDTEYGVVYIPGPDGPAPFASWAGGWSWCVPKGVADVETAFDVCAYLCGQEGQLKYNKDTYHIPTLKSVAEDPFFSEDPLHKVFMDLLPVSHTRPPIPFGSKLWDLHVKAYQDEIPHGLKTVEQALEDIDTEINKDLEDAGFFS